MSEYIDPKINGNLYIGYKDTLWKNIKDWHIYNDLEINKPIISPSFFGENQIKPKQHQQYSFNMNKMLLAYKPIKKVEALRLNWRLSSWHNDAKNFCRLYSRMVHQNLFNKSTLHLMYKWANMLLYFAKNGWNINKRLITISDKQSDLDMSSLWLFNLILQASKYSTLEELYNVKSIGADRVDIGVYYQYKITSKHVKPICSLLHTDFKVDDWLMVYKTIIGDKDFFYSGEIKSTSHQKIQNAIKKGLARYRSQKAKDQLINEIREKSEQRQQRVRTKIYCP